MRAKNNWQWIRLIVFLIIGGILLLAGLLFMPQSSSFQHARLIPVGIISQKSANYQVDDNAVLLPGVKMALVWDAVKDKNPDISVSELNQRQTTLDNLLLTPVPTVTPSGNICTGTHIVYAQIDTSVDSQQPDVILGSEASLSLSQSDTGSQQLMLYFPLNADLAPFTPILSAFLDLNIESQTDASASIPMHIFNLTSPFDESTTSWNTRPITDTPYTTIPSIDGSHQRWDATTIVRDWLSLRFTNNGILIALANDSSAEAVYTSREGAGADDSRRPQLIIDCGAGLPQTIAAIPETPTATILPPTIAPTNTPTTKPTATKTVPPSATPTQLPTVIASPTEALSPTPSATTLVAIIPQQPTQTAVSAPATRTATSVPPTPTFTSVPPTPTDTPVPTPTDTPVPTPTDTPVPTPTDTPVPTPTDTPVPTPTDTPVPTPTDTPVPTPTDTPVPTPTNTPVPPTSTFTPVPPTSTFTPVPPTSTFTPVPPTSTFTPVPTPTDTPVPTPTNTPVPTPTALAVADLLITKSDNPDPVNVGQPLTYTLTITNLGPSTATNIVVSDTFPANVNIGRITSSQGGCSTIGQTVVCNLGNLGAQPIVSSTFTTDVDGWTLTGGAVSSPNPNYSATGGNPDGYIWADDDSYSGVYYYIAPGKFLGDKSIAYRGNLAFDLRAQTGTNNPYNADHIRLSGGGIILTHTVTLPTSTWASYSLTLSETSGWTNAATMQAPSQAEMRSTLSNLTDLRILGEYYHGDDQSYLDNVMLTPGPAFITIVVTPTTTSALVNTATVSADTFDPNTANNTATATTTVIAGCSNPDQTDGFVLSTDPSDGANNVPLRPTITILFNQTMNEGTLNGTNLQLCTNNSIPCNSVVPTTLQITNTNVATDTVQMVPDNDLSNNGNYHIQIGTNVENICGIQQGLNVSHGFRTQ